jgi:hypothetical protein
MTEILDLVSAQEGPICKKRPRANPDGNGCVLRKQPTVVSPPFASSIYCCLHFTSPLFLHSMLAALCSTGQPFAALQTHETSSSNYADHYARSFLVARTLTFSCV